MNSPHEFLTARYAEEEKRETIYREIVARLTVVLGPIDPDASEIHAAHAAQIALTRTADRIAADVTAKREVLVHHRPATAEDTHEIGAHPSNDGRCSSCVASHDERGYCEQMDYPCPTIVAMLQPYTGHPDFDPARRVA